MFSLGYRSSRKIVLKGNSVTLKYLGKKAKHFGDSHMRRRNNRA